LAGRSQAVVVEGYKSSSLNINAGVPQGSVLGPTVFLIFVDNVRANLMNSLHLFADDATLDAQIDSHASACTVLKSLQDDLNHIEAWSKRWCVSFNASKCESFIISRKRQRCEPVFHFCGSQLTNVNKIKLLGLTFENDLSWSIHVTSLAKRASRLLGMLRRAQWVLPLSGKVTAYKAFVRPLMEYASPVWNGCYDSALHLLDIVQKRAISVFRIANPVELRIQPLAHRRIYYKPLHLLQVF